MQGRRARKETMPATDSPATRHTVARIFFAAMTIATLLGVGTAALVSWWGGLSGATPASAADALQVTKVLKHSSTVSAVSFSPNGKHLAAGSVLERTISIWDPRTGTIVKRLSLDVGGTAGLAWSPDGRILAVGRTFAPPGPGHVIVSTWDLASSRLVHDFAEPFNRVSPGTWPRSLAFRPDGKQLTVAVSGLAIYEPATGTLVKTITGHPALGSVASYSRDGRYLATSGEPRRAPIELYDARTGEHVRAFSGDISSQRVLAFSPEARFIAGAGGETPAITIWHVETGQPARAPFWGHTDPIRALIYTPDGRWLISASAGDSIKIWSVRQSVGMPEWGLVESVSLPYEAGRTISISPDGHALASSEGDLVKIWDFEAAVPALEQKLAKRGR